jgi:hypothetical protein
MPPMHPTLIKWIFYVTFMKIRHKLNCHEKKLLILSCIHILMIGTVTSQVLIPDSLFGINIYSAYFIPTGPEFSEIIDL